MIDVGVREIGGRFLVKTAPMAEAPYIDPGQPYQVSYNPGVAGLNLNLNRVHFEWKRAGQDYDITMQARDYRYRPACNTATMEVIDRPGPVFDFKTDAGIEQWSVARGALGRNGARWLPVRDPVNYTIDAFRTILKSLDIELPPAVRVQSAPAGITLVERTSAPMADILRRMLKDSTNLTAEVVGQTATNARGVMPGTLRRSADEMSEWLRQVSSARRPRFVDHSGLGPNNDVTPKDMVSILAKAGPESMLSDLMKPWYFRSASGATDKANPVKITAKTGTLNFVSGLAGFIQPPQGRALAFAIFSADEPRRDELTRAERERPTGGKTWARKARTLDDLLLKQWTKLYV